MPTDAVILLKSLMLLPQDPNVVGGTDASYALYLIHFPLVAVMSKVAIIVLPKSASGASIGFCLLVFSSVVAAIIFNKLIERPMLRFFAPNPATAQRL